MTVIRDPLPCPRVDDPCDSDPRRRQGMCHRHYERARVAGLLVPARIDPLTRYEVDGAGCWVWTGPLYANGYGHWPTDSESLAHRAFYKHHVGDPPPGTQLDHLCRNRACVNPGHLEPVAGTENRRRGAFGFTVTCRKGGHDVTDPAAVYVSPNGTRRCRACLSAWTRQAYLRRKAARYP